MLGGLLAARLTLGAGFAGRDKLANQVGLDGGCGGLGLCDCCRYESICEGFDFCPDCEGLLLFGCEARTQRPEPLQQFLQRSPEHIEGVFYPRRAISGHRESHKIGVNRIGAGNY